MLVDCISVSHPGPLGRHRRAARPVQAPRGRLRGRPDKLEQDDGPDAGAVGAHQDKDHTE